MFTPAQLRQPVSALSGGERNRLTLALALAKTSNLMVLDEPTNDLDMETLDLLEEMLMEYEGTLIVASHDRAFLDGVVTSILTPEGGGHWLETPGGYSDYLSQKRETAKKNAKPIQTHKSKAASKSASQPTKKLTYKDQHRLDELDKKVPETEAEITELEAALADPDLYSTQPDLFAKKAKRLDAARDELEEMEMEWLELQEKLESLNSD
jgi:ATP-binding cassette subfamily F protein uup